METRLEKQIKDVLSSFPKYWDGETLIKTRVIEDLRNYKEELITKLLEKKLIKETYSIEVGSSTVFKIDEFIQMLRYRNYWESSYTRYRSQIGLTSEGKYLRYNTDVVLDFPYKDAVLEAGMTKEDIGKEEIYYHNVLAKEEIDELLSPKVLTNVKKYSKDGKKTITEANENDNLIIKGNNLTALHSLKGRYASKVKLIYIDPPYNTGSDSFKYNDRFNQSTWLTFMKNRLEVARTLLRDDGIIMVQCDDSEQEYLKVLMNEVFGVDNHLSTFYIQVRYPDKQLATAMNFHKLIETIFIFGKTKDAKVYREREKYSLDKYVFSVKELGKANKVMELGDKKVEVFHSDNYEIVKHETGKKEYLKEIWASGKILNSSSTGRFFRDYIEGRVEQDGLGVLYKVHGIGSGLGYRYITGPKRAGATKGKYYQEVPAEKLSEEYKGDLKAIPNYYNMADSFGNCRHEGGVELRSGKKPERLLKKLIEISTKEGDLILDYHLGSGTTAAVSMKMNRRFIGIEQMDYGENSPVRRLVNVINGDKTGISKEVDWQGGGSFVYAELCSLNHDYIGKIQSADTHDELNHVLEEIKDNAYLNFKVDFEQLTLSNEEFQSLSLEQKKKILTEALDMNQLYLNYSEIDDKQYDIDEETKLFNHSFYKGDEGVE